MVRRAFPVSLILSVLLGLLVAGNVGAASAVGLGTAGSFAVLGGSAVTNTGPSLLNGDLGVHPGTSVSGFPPGVVIGTIHAADAVAAQAQTDLTVAYNNVAGQPCDTNLTGQNLGGLTLTTGVYCFDSTAQLTGTVTLNAQGDPDALFIFQIGSSLTTASASTVSLINGAQACNVFWQVGSSATLGTASSFVGNILALTSITLTTGADLDGRALARNGAVTLDSNVITRGTCDETAATECTSTLTGGTYAAIDVPDGATCTLVGVIVTGDVTVGEGSKLLTSAQTQIGGDVTSVRAKSVQLINTDVVGDIDLSRTTGKVVIGDEGCSVDPIVGGNITIRGSRGTVAVCKMSVLGSLFIRNNRYSTGLFENVVAGNLVAEGNSGYGLWVRSNSVGGYALIRENTVSFKIVVKNNVIVGDLRCHMNAPDPRHAGNTVGGMRLGECSTPE